MRVPILLLLLSSLWEGLGIANRSRSRKIEPCSPTDYRFSFTECDVTGERWRVAIPSIGCENQIPPIPPKKLDECYKSCEAGQFLNLTNVECEECEPGSYSLGGGIRFEEWDPLPKGFNIRVEKFRSFFSRQPSVLNCTNLGWKTRGDVILSHGSFCVAILAYSAQILKPGKIKFTYQYPDDSVIFQFQANSEQCQSALDNEGSRWPVLTGEGIWRTEEIPLRTGLNYFSWKTMGTDVFGKPVLIKKIEIDGVGFTSECNACKPGSFSKLQGSSNCDLCPKNSFSGHKAIECSKCEEKLYYSESGAESCRPRPPCTIEDFYPIHTPCDVNNKTMVIYKWIEPKICVEGEVSLPQNGNLEDCPPCNPGTEYRAGNCLPCPMNKFSDGLSSCAWCPVETVPDNGHFLSHWYTWPHNAHAVCISPEEYGCSESPPWQLSGSYVESGKGSADWVYLVMTVAIGGFRGNEGIVNGELRELGRITFSFSLDCVQNCELLFMQGTKSKNATVVQRWTNSQARQVYTHIIFKNESFNFTWAFQKMSWDSIANDQNDWIKASESSAKIYEINITNTIDGGTSTCKPCQKGLVYSKMNQEEPKCVPCSPGHFRANQKNSKMKRNDSSQCEPCPSGYVSSDPFSMTSSSCRPCGKGLKSNDGISCVTDCLLELRGLTYDLRPLRGIKMVRGASLFTSSGTQYYHIFNISFCSDKNAECYKNVTLQRGYENQDSKVEALVCQSTIFPPNSGGSNMDGGQNGFFDLKLGREALSTHASSLGDHLLGISNVPTLNEITIPEESNISAFGEENQFHFFYSTLEPTIACTRGRSTTMTLRCRLPSSYWKEGDTKEESNIKTPEKCPDGTCDGCNFHFIWESPYACHICKQDELMIIRGECRDGEQSIHYLPQVKSQCLLVVNSTWPKSRACKNHLPLFIELSIEFGVGLTCLMAILLICFWQRNKKLQYKYMKLVASSGTRNNDRHGNCDNINNSEGDMLPIAESCALDEDEDDDEPVNFMDRGSSQSSLNNEIGFYSGNSVDNLVSKFSLFRKLKKLSRKRNDREECTEILNMAGKDDVIS